MKPLGGKRKLISNDTPQTKKIGEKKGKENKDKEQANQEQSRQTTDINSTESSDGIGRSTEERVKENQDKLIQGKTQGT